MKYILYTVLVVIALFVGYWTIIIVSLVGIGKFYVPFISIGVVILLICVYLNMFHIISSKKMKKIWLTFLSLMLASCAIHEVRSAYDRRILRVRQSVNLGLYAPFGTNTLAAKLDTASTLRIDTDLPLLDGATALYPVYSAFAQAVYPKKEYAQYDSEVACNNTIRAYNKLINRAGDIIFVAPPSEEQLKMAEQAGVKFNYTSIGKEAFVFFVNAHNPVENLTVTQLQDIYAGKITNWQALGGRDEGIRAFQRNENSGSQTAFVHFMQGKTIMKPPKEDVIAGMGGIVSQTADYANYGNSIGFSFRFYVNEMTKNNEVKILKVNDVYPNIETISNGDYLMASPFFAVTLADNKKPEVTALLEWIVSEQGQYLVEKTGYCSMR
ncbi:MAG: substrate-binding domain-containing protein [Prevotellaceae bacterium]|jgi:phosphate transport system substrate-binding protein|nr:substrate-binding domain-containing protein [Prevotellaceae bacterium]